ncbi:MAG TPA: hypothetical protein VIM87_04695 [Chitinophaga sp.]|uniref:hypothetical protein n=1 Tax=Chitinophaga sp. TaxID=1869181 RepID=UPI002F949E4C
MKHIKYLICITAFFLSCAKQGQDGSSGQKDVMPVQASALAVTAFDNTPIVLDPAFESCYGNYTDTMRNGATPGVGLQTFVDCLAPHTDKWTLGWPATKPGKLYPEAPICYPCIHQLTNISMLLDLLQLSDASAPAETDLVRLYLEPYNNIITKGILAAPSGTVGTPEEKHRAVMNYLNTITTITTDERTFMIRYIDILFGRLTIPKTWAEKLYYQLMKFTDLNGNVTYVKGPSLFLGTIGVTVI